MVNQSNLTPEYVALQKDIATTQQSLFTYMRQNEQFGAQLNVSAMQGRLRTVTLRALEQLPAESIKEVCRSVGKAYVFAPVDELKDDYKKDIDRLDQEVTALKKANEFALKRQKDYEQKLQELLRQLQRQ